MASAILYLEPIGGLAGDMFLAAALDLGVDREALLTQLKTLNVPGWELRVTRTERHHLGAAHVTVVTDEAAHVHRRYRDIEQLISASGLSDGAKKKALRVFRLVGEVEAKIHGATLDDIHFHEVGAVDSIIDICGAAVVLELLGDPRVYCAPPPLGSGTVKIAHGVVPVPVPATLALLEGVPVKFEGEGELVTPTGAALIKAFATVGTPPPMTVEKHGYGAGTKDFADRANLVRMSLGSGAMNRAPGTTVQVLECNLDDTSPQLLGALIETLLSLGALDAWITPVVMKKGRPGHLVSVLTDSAHHDTLTDALLRETTTLGVREYTVTRTSPQGVCTVT